jgi:hypothetical protein
MRLSKETQLTHRERLNRGLAHTAAGPVDVARGAVGLSGAAVQRGASELRRRYRESRLADHVADAADTAARELAAAQELVSGLPDVLAYGEPRRRRIRRSWVIVGAAGVALLVGGVAAVLIRRSDRPEEPSPRPPSVDTQHKI